MTPGSRCSRHGCSVCKRTESCVFPRFTEERIQSKTIQYLPRVRIAYKCPVTSWCPLSLPPLTNFDLLSSLYVRDVLTNKAKVRTVRYRSGSGTDVGLPVTFLPLSLSLSYNNIPSFCSSGSTPFR